MTEENIEEDSDEDLKKRLNDYQYQEEMSKKFVLEF